jgi:ABC-type molybdenum transport system ATPase subunit/photorepair protein PhrA
MALIGDRPMSHIAKELGIITPPSKYQNIFSRQTPIKQYFYAAKIQIIGWWSNNVTQQFKNIAKNLDLSMGIQNVVGKTIKTLYMPLNQPNNQDIPYMRQSFWINLNYKF